MKTINTYYDGFTALAEFVAENQAVLINEKPALLVQVFSGVCEKEFLINLSREIRQLLPHAQVIGTTTSGEIMNGKVSGLKTVLSFSVFYHSKIRCTCISKLDGTDYQLGHSMASFLCCYQAKALIMFASGLNIDANKLLKGVEAVCPSLPVSGGNAGDNSRFIQCFVLCDDEITDCGAVGAILEGEALTANCYWHLGWQPIGKEMTLTKTDDRRVYTIDHIPAYDIYQKYLGLEESGEFLNNVEYPLVAQRNGMLIARIPNVHYEDGSLGFMADVFEGEKVRFSYGHVGIILDQIDGLCKQIQEEEVESIFVYSCISRRGFLQENTEIETTPLQEIAPTSGFFTYGEYFHAGNTNQLLNATLTVLVLSEEEKTEKLPRTTGTVTFKRPGEKSVKPQDNVVRRNLGVLTTLTHLANKVTAELEEVNEQLQFVSSHDSLTGLYNRHYFEQEMRRFQAGDEAVGIIMCDVDCLKLMNDLLGHEFGDRIIQKAAEVIMKSCGPQDIVARIGGDEFAILAPNSDISRLEEMCSKIVKAAADYIIQGTERSLLHVSVGHALKGTNGAHSMVEAFKQADADMYRIKVAGTAKIQKQIIKYLTNIPGARKDNRIEQYSNWELTVDRMIEREWAENLVRHEMERAAALLQISARFNTALCYNELLEVICQEGTQVLNASAAYLHIYDNLKEEYRVEASYGLLDSKQLDGMPNLQELFDDNGIAVADELFLMVNGDKEVLESMKVKGLVSIRLANEQQFMGTLNLIITQKDFILDDNDLALLKGLRDLVEVHIVKARLYEDNKNQLEAITALYNNAKRLGQSLDMGNIAQDVCRTCVESFDFPLAWVGKAEKDGTVRVIGVYPEMDYPHEIKVRWDNTPEGLGPTGKATRSGRPYFVNDIRKNSPPLLSGEIALSYGLESMAAYPLISEGKSFGALMVFGANSGFFSPEKSYYIQAYAHQAAAALQNAKLYKDAQWRAACMKSLRDIDVSIVNYLDLNQILNVVLDQVISRLYVDAADIYLIDYDSMMMQYVLGKGYNTEAVPHSSIELERGLFDLEKLMNNCCSVSIPPFEEHVARLAQEGLTRHYKVPLIAKGKLLGIMEIFCQKPFPQEEEWYEFLNMLANQTAIAIETSRLFNDLKRSNMELISAYDATIEGWSHALDLRDKETEGHSHRVTEMTLRLAKMLGLNDEELVNVRRGALLHDIGKMGIPDSILLKPGPLNPEEWIIMKKHPLYSYNLLSPIEHLHPALDIPYSHHERWDGTGYPRGLKGEEIPLVARIFAVVDVWDALNSDRPYRKAWSQEKIKDYIISYSGVYFDPEVVGLFLKMMDNDK